MTTQSFKALGAVLLATVALSVSTAATAAAGASSYYVVVPVLGKRAPAPVIAVTLTGATLPAGVAGALYPSVDLNSSLQVTGDPSYNAAQVAWDVTAGVLPAGLQLNAGVLSGTPTMRTAETDFTVQATYKLKSGQQAYTIVVKGVPLQVVSVSAGGNHTCAVTTVGGLKCWGNDEHGQLGNDVDLIDQSAPVDVAGLTSDVVSVATGVYHTCALTTMGGLKCWGADGNGQLGNGTDVSNQEIPGDVLGLTSGVTSVSSGYYHTCAVTSAGGLKCWGADHLGQLGNDVLKNPQHSPVDVLGLTSGVVSVAAGGNHACALTTTGGLLCWGSDTYGQLGNDGNKIDKPTPVAVAGLTAGVIRVTAGGAHVCAVTTTGGLKCWGSDTDGQLGNDAVKANQPMPVDVLGLTSGVASVACGGFHTCAVTTTGGLKCWGADSYGQLGNGTVKTNQSIPVDVIGLTSGVASVVTGYSHTCAVTTTGVLKCWGANTYGQLGNDAVGLSQQTPADVLN